MLVALLEVAADESLCLYHDVLDEGVVFLRIHGQAQLLHLPQYISSVRLSVRSEHLEVLPVVGSALSFEYVDVKIGELRDAEIEVACAVGVRVEQVSACPVEHWHEVIAYGVYAFCCQIAQALLVYLYLLVAVRASVFYCLGDGQRLDYRPSHAVRLDVLPEVMYLLACPHLSQWHIVKCGHDALDTDLLQHGKCYLIVLAKPSPCSFHCVLLFML